jgi:secreted trypsin-like serine protease
MFLKLFLTLILVNFSLCENEVFTRPENSRILNGEILDIEDVPYYVSLFQPYKGHVCGGSIIATKWILSAATCFVGLINFLGDCEYFLIKNIFKKF